MPVLARLIISTMLILGLTISTGHSPAEAWSRAGQRLGVKERKQLERALAALGRSAVKLRQKLSRRAMLTRSLRRQLRRLKRRAARLKRRLGRSLGSVCRGMSALLSNALEIKKDAKLDIRRARQMKFLRAIATCQAKHREIKKKMEETRGLFRTSFIGAARKLIRKAVGSGGLFRGRGRTMLSGVRAQASRLKKSAASDTSARKCDPDSAANWGGDNLPLPPYELKLAVTALVYAVPARRLRKAIPRGLKLFSLLGRAPLIVLGAHYTESRSVGSNAAGPCYDEIGYATMVTRKGVKGGFFLKIHLDSQIGMEIGVKQYGFPKSLARMTYRDDGETLMISAHTQGGNRLLGKFKVRRKSGIFGRLLGRLAGIGLHAATMVMKGSCFSKGKRLIWADMTLKPKSSTGYPVKVKYARFPYLSRKGWLKPREAKRPLAAFTFNEASIHLDKPTVAK